MGKARPKRFYEKVETAKIGDGFGIHLDGRVLKAPGKRKLTLILPSAHVAELVAAEWDAQEVDINPEVMPVTRLANVALELTPGKRPELVSQARSYAETDLLCYRSDQYAVLTRRQAALWDPVLAWAADLGVKLVPTESIIAKTQSAESLDRLEAFAIELDDLNLTLFLHLTSVFGSAVLALAVMKKHLSGAEAFDLSRLDALWQIEHWGQDEEAQDNSDAVAAEVSALCRILEN